MVVWFEKSHHPSFSPNPSLSAFRFFRIAGAGFGANWKRKTSSN